MSNHRELQGYADLRMKYFVILIANQNCGHICVMLEYIITSLVFKIQKTNSP